MAARDDATDALESMLRQDGASAAEALIAANGQDLFAYFARRVGSPDDAADLTGDVFLVVWRKADSVPSDPLAARMWAFGVARNVLSNHYRSTRRRLRLEQRLVDEFTPETDLADLRATVADALAQLAPTDREIVRLVHWEGFALTQVAVILGHNAATVRSRYARARKRLASYLSAV